MSVIAASGTLASARAEVQLIFRATSGVLWAIFDVSSVAKYAVSTDGGATWGAAASLGGGFKVADILATCPIPSTDTVTVLYKSSSSTWALCAIQFTTGANTAACTTARAPSPTISSAVYAGALAWDSAHSVVHYAVAFLQSSSGLGLMQINHCAAVPAALTTPQNVTGSGTVRSMSLIAVTGTTPVQLYLTYVEDENGIFVSAPTYNGTVYAFSNPSLEGVAFNQTANFNDIRFVTTLDAANKLDITIRVDGGIYATKRVSQNTYSPLAYVYGGANGFSELAYGYDSASGDVLLFFRADVGHANGEIYMLRRKNGTWQLPVSIAGADDAGYDRPSAVNAATTAGTQVIFTHGAAVEMGGAAFASAPTQPTVTAPNGNEASLTPTLIAAYVNPSSGDPQKSYQWQVQTADGITTMWDTGEVTSTATSVLYAGTTLVYGTQYRARVRYKDSLTVSGAGTWSSWSNWQTFTPVQGPAPTLTDIVAGGVTINTFPHTLPSPLLAADLVHHQPDAHAANKAQLLIYEVDGVTLRAAGTLRVLSPTVGDGAAIALVQEDFSGHLANGDVVKLAVATTDAVTGVSGQSALVTVTCSWTGTGVPSSLRVSGEADKGWATARWANTPETVSVELTLEWTGPEGAVSVTEYGGPAITQKTIYPCPGVLTTVRVTGTDANGLAATATQTVVLDLRGADESQGIWFNDVDDHTIAVALAAPAQQDVLGWTWVDNAESAVMMGDQYEKTWYDLTGFHATQNGQWQIADYFLRDNTFVTAEEDIAIIAHFAKTHNVALYRDVFGNRWPVQIRGFVASPQTDGTWLVTFAMREQRPLTAALG